MLPLSAQASITALADLGEACQAFDIQVQQIAGMRMFIAHHRHGRFEIAPPAQSGPSQDTTDRGHAQLRLARYRVSRTTLTA